MNIKTFSDLKKDFVEILEKSIDKKFTIDNEIKEVLDFVNDVREISAFRAPKLTYKKQSKFSCLFVRESNILFQESFKSIIQLGDYEIEEDYSETEATLLYKNNVVKQAKEFVEYYKWLKSLNDDTSKIVKKSNQLTHKQKMLTLHYLGFDFSKYDNTKIAKVLSEVLELDVNNTRQYLSYLIAGKNEVRTKQNLQVVKKLFENQGLSDISSTIEKDIEKL